MDNLGLDSTAHPLTMYAQAELLVFQNKFAEAFTQMDLLSNLYPEHGLLDDILYLKGRILVKQRKYADAVAVFGEVSTTYPEGIRADNALFAMAGLYENQLGDPDKAKELYEKIFVDYSGSTFSVEARKRFRILRGDFSPDEELN
jgi:TolA-binding protein